MMRESTPEVDYEFEQLQDNQRAARNRVAKLRQELREVETASRAAVWAIEGYRNRKSHRSPAGAA